MAKEKNKTEKPVVLEGELQARLIQLREDAGYSTSQLADAMCLSEDVILHLENEDFDQLAEPPYVRGYLRNYAKLGDIDSEELISRYESLRGADTKELNYQIKTANINVDKRKRISPVWAQLILLALLIAGIGLLSMIPSVNQWITTTWNGLSNQLQPSNGEAGSNPLLTGSLPIPAPLPNSEGTEENSATDSSLNMNDTQSGKIPASQDKLEDTNKNKSQESVSTKNTTDSENTDKEEVKEVSDSKNTEQAITEKEAETTDTGNQLKIKLVFNKDVWLRIKNKDNKTIYEGLNKIGTSKDLTAEKPLTFRVGNAQGLSLFVDDKAVDISQYINGSIANFTLE